MERCVIVKCSECGFLGKRGKRTFDGECVTASSDERDEGDLYRHWFESGRFTDTVPWCLVNEANIRDEIEQLQGPVNPRTITVISKERDCKGWYPWREFSSPKEHLAERNMQQLENERREFERRLVQMQIDAERKIGKVGIWIGIAAIILGIAEVLSAGSDSWFVAIIRSVFDKGG